MRYTILITILPFITVGMTYLFNRVFYGDDPRKHFSKKLAFAIALVVAVAFLPASINDIRTSFSEWKRCIAARTISCFALKSERTAPSELSEEDNDTPKAPQFRWAVIRMQRANHGLYTSDLLLSQTSLQLGFSCVPLSALIQLNFAGKLVKNAVFPVDTAPERIVAYFSFRDSKRTVPLQMFYEGPQENGDILYTSYWDSADQFQIENVDQVLRSALENEDDFSVGVAHGSVEWESAIYDMERAREYWLEANSSRRGKAISNSEVCNYFATR